MIARIAAALVALTALAGLVIQYDVTLAQTGSVVGTFWIMLRFFTILTNCGVALTFAAVALGWRVTPGWLGGILLAILLVGVIVILLLHGLLVLSGNALLADRLLHEVTPLLVLLWWLAFAPKGALGRRDPFLWALYPALYLPYALLRGMAEGIYAYPFINVARLGMGQVLVNAVLIAAGFILAGYCLLWIDRQLARRYNI